MARIFPFRGYRYNPRIVSDIGAVITEPYDKIDDKLREKYYERQPYNIARLIKGKTEDTDGEGDNRYTRARDYLNHWIDEGILARDKTETIYVYTEEYSIGEGPAKTRRGFIALGALEEFGEGGVMPHERTLSGPKADRLNLMRATGTQFGLIFMLYPDPENEVNRVLESSSGRKPDIETTDDNGVIHRLWAVTDPAVHEKVTELMGDKQLFIADGHHRYETALNYRREMGEKGVACAPGNENYDNRMMAFVSMQDPGLTILPTYRLLFNLTGEQLSSLPKGLSRYFAMDRCPGLEALLDGMKTGNGGRPRFGLYLDGGYTLLTLRGDAPIAGIVRADASDDWKRLDVTIIHAVLEELLGIDREKLEAETNVAYERYADAAVRRVDEGKYQAAVFLNPTKADQVAAVAGNGERMPQKSTDFYPKLYTGLVINKLNYS